MGPFALSGASRPLMVGLRVGDGLGWGMGICLQPQQPASSSGAFVLPVGALRAGLSWAALRIDCEWYVARVWRVTGHVRRTEGESVTTLTLHTGSCAVRHGAARRTCGGTQHRSRPKSRFARSRAPDWCPKGWVRGKRGGSLQSKATSIVSV